nr:acetyl-CoA carboxylase beta subunit [Streptosarcina sp. YL-2023a]
MSILAWIEDQRKLKLLNAPKYNHPASDGSQGLWTRCDNCGVILYIKHLKENQRVCFGCGYHLQMNSLERIEHLVDQETWRPLDETLSPCDPLEFKDQKLYTERLKEAQERTGLQDAVQTGTGMLDGIPIALGVMDFNFMGGSMGSVVGEKITRLIEYATQEGLILVLVCASGGARMQEGILSLMQMAKISAALQIYQSCANLLYISVLTSPTTGGVTASFAMLGDLIFAEPKALIGFAGRRVIEQTLQEQLPDDFQTAEYLLHHGLLDLIIPRSFLKQALSETITLYKEAPYKQSGIIPHGIQNNLGFITEEKVRRKWNNFAEFNFPKSENASNTNSLVFLNPKDQTAENSQTTDIANPSKVQSSASEAHLENLCFSYKELPSEFSYREILNSFQSLFSLFSGTFINQEQEYSQTNSQKVSYAKNINNPEDKNELSNLINESLQSATKNSLEWRAVYVNEQTEPKKSFIEALINTSKKSHTSSEILLEQNVPKKIEKRFFYRFVDEDVNGETTLSVF